MNRQEKNTLKQYDLEENPYKEAYDRGVQWVNARFVPNNKLAEIHTACISYLAELHNGSYIQAIMQFARDGRWTKNYIEAITHADEFVKGARAALLAYYESEKEREGKTDAKD